MSQIYLEIENPESLMGLIREAKGCGLMRDISLEEVKRSVSSAAFPIRIPVKLDALIGLAGNPILKKMFGKKLEDATKTYLKKAMAESG